MQVLLRESIAVNPGFLAQLYFVERLLIRNVKEEERGKSLRVHCKVCSQLQSSSHTDDGPLLYTGEHTIDQNLLEGPFICRSMNGSVLIVTILARLPASTSD